MIPEIFMDLGLGLLVHCVALDYCLMGKGRCPERPLSQLSGVRALCYLKEDALSAIYLKSGCSERPLFR